MVANGTAAAAGAGTAVSMNGNRLVKWTMYALMMYPIIDFGLRHTLHVLTHFGPLWDKLAFLILLVMTVVRYLSGYRPPRYRWYTYAAWFIMFGLGLTIAGFANPIVAMQGYRDDIYYLLFAFLIPFNVRAEDAKPLLHIGAVVAILIAIHAIYQYITRAPFPQNWLSTPGQVVRTRTYSVFASSNELGAYMALMTPIMAGLALHEQDRVRKWAYAIGTLLCFIALYTTLTRGAWLALAAALLIVGILFERRLLAVLIVLGAIGFFLPPVQHRLDEFLSPVYWINASSSGRIYRWMQAFQTMSNSPLTGVGMGQYGGAVSAIYNNGTYSDNFYGKIMGEMGLVGLMLFMTMHFGLLRDIFKHAIRPARGRERYLFVGAFAGLLAMLLHNFTENVFEDAPSVITYFLYATLFLTLARGLAKEDQHAANETSEH